MPTGVLVNMLAKPPSNIGCDTPGPNVHNGALWLFEISARKGCLEIIYLEYSMEKCFIVFFKQTNFKFDEYLD